MAMDNLRLSAAPGLSETRHLRSRSNAVTLSRASDQARKILDALQAKQPQPLKTPRPSVVTAPSAPTQVTAPSPERLPPTSPAGAAPAKNAALLREIPPTAIEALKREARLTLADFSKNILRASACMPIIPDAATAVAAAVRTAVATACNPATPPARA